MLLSYWGPSLVSSWLFLLSLFSFFFLLLILHAREICRALSCDILESNFADNFLQCEPGDSWISSSAWVLNKEWKQICHWVIENRVENIQKFVKFTHQLRGNSCSEMNENTCGLQIVLHVCASKIFTCMYLNIHFIFKTHLCNITMTKVFLTDCTGNAEVITFAWPVVADFGCLTAYGII